MSGTLLCPGNSGDIMMNNCCMDLGFMLQLEKLLKHEARSPRCSPSLSHLVWCYSQRKHSRSNFSISQLAYFLLDVVFACHWAAGHHVLIKKEQWVKQLNSSWIYMSDGYDANYKVRLKSFLKQVTSLKLAWESFAKYISWYNSLTFWALGKYQVFQVIRLKYKWSYKSLLLKSYSLIFWTIHPWSIDQVI